MLAIIGNLCITCALIFGVINFAFLLNKKQFRFAQIASTVSTFCAMFTLIYAFVSSDFTLQNVFINSSTLNPIIFKIGASWSSHQGSLMLFLAMLSGFCLYSACAMPESEIKYLASMLQQMIVSSLLFVTWISANPFETNMFVASEGIGLNPLLQDIGVVYHPPIIYLGYASCLIPFSYCVFLYKNINDRRLDLLALVIFSRIAMIFLTLGIGLGSWWAYRELGWGGFWFFDPVENISLMPWLCAIAFHHSLIITIKNYDLHKWMVFFGLLLFPLILFGMFLVRSNLLISVHSFALDLTKAIMLAGIAGVSFLTSFYSYYKYRQIYFPQHVKYRQNIGFKIANIFWLIAITSVVLSIILPILVRIFYKLELVLEADYFVITLLPILVGINFLIAVYAYIHRYQSYHIVILLILLSCCSCLIYYFKIKLLLAYLAIFAGGFLVVISISMLILDFNYGKNSTINFGMFLGHLSYGILTLSIALNVSNEMEVDLIGTKNTTTLMGNFQVALQDIKYSYGPNYLRQIAVVNIYNNKNGQLTILNPENRWYVIEGKMTAESSIYSFIDYDLYAVLNRIEGDKAHVKIYYRPYISFMWLSVITMALSFLISIISKNIKFNNKS